MPQEVGVLKRKEKRRETPAESIAGSGLGAKTTDIGLTRSNIRWDTC